MSLNNNIVTEINNFIIRKKTQPDKLLFEDLFANITDINNYIDMYSKSTENQLIKK